MSTRRRAKPRNYPPPPLRPCHVCGAVTRRRIPAPVPLCSDTCAAQLIESVYPVQSLQGFSVLLTCARAYACQLETPTEATEATLVRVKPLARAATSPARTSLSPDQPGRCREPALSAGGRAHKTRVLLMAGYFPGYNPHTREALEGSV